MDTTVDTTEPTVTFCPQSSTYTVSLDTPSREVTWIEPTATDNSGVAPMVIQSHRSGESFHIGATDVMYLFTDEAGNQASCSFVIMGNYHSMWMLRLMLLYQHE